jgi:hypothetical protein
MFETPEEIKEKSPKGMWIALVVVAVAVVVGVLLYMRSRGGAPVSAPVAASAPAQAPVKTDADPVRDLKVQRAAMNKDRTGTMAVWSVSIENKSPSFSYSNIKYETTYIGADNNAVLINKGTIATTIGPGEQKTSEFSDALFPAGTAWYKLRITGATPSAQ